MVLLPLEHLVLKTIRKVFPDQGHPHLQAIQYCHHRFLYGLSISCGQLGGNINYKLHNVRGLVYFSKYQAATHEYKCPTLTDGLHTEQPGTYFLEMLPPHGKRDM